MFFVDNRWGEEEVEGKKKNNNKLFTSLRVDARTPN